MFAKTLFIPKYCNNLQLLHVFHLNCSVLERLVTGQGEREDVSSLSQPLVVMPWLYTLAILKTPLDKSKKAIPAPTNSASGIPPVEANFTHG